MVSIVNTCPPARTSRTRTVARVKGRVRVKAAPPVGTCDTSTAPRSFSTFLFTISRPIPRPERLVTVAEVETPGSKTRRRISASACLPCVLSPVAALSKAKFRPRPSSSTRTSIRFPRIAAETRILPFSGRPAVRRSSGVWIPCATALRTRWRSESCSAETMERSTSNSPPLISSSARLPDAAATSRTMRPRPLQASAKGCVRASLISSSSAVTALCIRRTSWRRNAAS